MYNGIGLQTARGSGTNGYVQTNKFFIRPKTAKVLTDSSKGYGPDQGTAGIGKKPNKEILEHDRKRQIELKLAVLEDKLIDQGYTDAEIVDKLNDARASLEAADAATSHYGGDSIIPIEKNVSDTQTHQIAARKEKQLETLRAALGISMPEDKAEKHPGLSDLDVHENDDEKPRNHKKGVSEGDGEYEEGEILHGNEDKDARLGLSNKGHSSVRDKQSEGRDNKQKKQGRSRKVDDKKKKKRAYSSTESDSDSMQSTDSEHDSPIDTKRKQSSQRKSKKKMLSSSNSSASDSDDSDGAHGRRRPGRQIHKYKKHEEKKAQGRKKKNYSESRDSDTERKNAREISDESDYKNDDSVQKHQRRGSNRHDSDSDDSDKNYEQRKSEDLEPRRLEKRGRYDYDDKPSEKSNLRKSEAHIVHVDEHKDDNRGRNKNDSYRKMDAEIADKRDDTRFRRERDRDTHDEDADLRRRHIQEDRWVADDSTRGQQRDEMEYEKHGNNKRGRRDEDDHGRRRHDRDRDSSKRSRYEESSPSHRSHRDHARHNEDRYR